MKESLLKYDGSTTPTNPEQLYRCEQSVARIKGWVKDYLKLDENRCLLVSVCGECDDKAETMIMINCKDSERMRSYKINKPPQSVQQEDIPQMFAKECKFDVKKVGLLSFMIGLFCSGCLLLFNSLA